MTSGDSSPAFSHHHPSPQHTTRRQTLRDFLSQHSPPETSSPESEIRRVPVKQLMMELSGKHELTPSPRTPQGELGHVVEHEDVPGHGVRMIRVNMNARASRAATLAYLKQHPEGGVTACCHGQSVKQKCKDCRIM